ncbi:MAG: TatD family hydrolase [Acidobacteriota bacterium]|nr:TatD family hydrolase [Acidobacteriota bacterium]
MNLMPVLIDSHCHLDGPEYEPDRDAVIARAREAGVEHMLVIGTGASYQEIGAAIPIAGRIEGALCAAGIHPHEASKFLDSDFGELREMARQPKFAAIGEIGLDYHYDHSPRDAQREILIRQLALARELKLPILVHCREAWDDLRRILREHWLGCGLEGVLHCFTGSRDDAFAMMDWGFMVSFAGNLTFKNANNLRDVAREIPADRLLTETDCPFLAPVPHRGKRNEPAYVAEVLRQLVEVRGADGVDLAAQVLQNFKSFFGL